MDIKISKYQTEKDSVVEVHKVFGDEYYITIAELKGRYPEVGKIAHDQNRYEYIYVLEGQMTLNLNGETINMQRGESKLVSDGDKYFLEGEGRALVFVKDGQGGESKIELLK